METILNKPALYNLLYKDVKEDIELYNILTKGYDEIVEYGAGTGRVTIPLAMQGKKIIAIDNEKKMLNDLKNKIKKLHLEKNIRIVNANMITYTQDEKERCVIMPLTVFNYIIQDEDQQICLSNISKYLENGGILIIELLTKKTFMELHNNKYGTKNFEFIKKLTTKDGYYEYWRKTSLDNLSNIIIQERLFKHYNYKQKLDKQETFIWKNKYITYEDINAKLKKAGFEIDNVYGNCKMEPYQSDSEDLFIKAIKQK